jgi:hypothetical protein
MDGTTDWEGDGWGDNGKEIVELSPALARLGGLGVRAWTAGMEGSGVVGGLARVKITPEGSGSTGGTTRDGTRWALG